MNRPIWKTKRFWAIAAGAVSAAGLAVQGNYPGAVSALLTAIGLN
jgi:hypothetical protein